MAAWDVRHSCWLVVVAVASVTLAAVPGPIDPRYPDVIVYPRVKCLQEGVFPHPWNCSWFYRCVDRMNLGFFSTFYFECEAGTVFSDELDQCIFPFLVGPPCGTYLGPGLLPSPGPPTPQPVPGPVSSPGTATPPVIPAPQPGTPAPQPGTPGTQSGTPGTQSGTPGTQPGSPGIQPGTPITQPETPITQPGTPATQPGTPVTPVTQPGTPVTQPGTPAPQPGPSGSPSLPQTPDGSLPIPSSCRFNDTVCERHEVCEPNRETLDLCSGCYQGTEFLGASELCNDDIEVIDRTQNVCVSPPVASRLCGSTPGSGSSVSVTIPSSNSIRCSGEDLRPSEPWILNNYCRDFVLCHPSGSFKDVLRLCWNYFECLRRPDGSWFIEQRNCEDDRMYSYKEGACVATPADSELCFIGGGGGTA